VWSTADIEIESNDEPEGRLVCVDIRPPAGLIVMMGEIEVRGRALHIEGAHIGGLAPNTLGVAGLAVIARRAMEICNVDEVVVRGATRTTGRREGRVPRPIRFRR
jgi:hypothetical protein